MKAKMGLGTAGRKDSCSIKVHLFCEEMHILQPTGPLPSAFTFLLNGLFPLFTSLHKSQR